MAFAVAAACALAPHAHANIRVPAGFESLLTGQHEQIDLRFLGQSLGLVPALVKPDTIQFEQPDQVLEMLLTKAAADSSPLADQTTLLHELSQALKRNGGLVCPVGTTTAANGCGYLDTDGVAVIYDERQSEASLFIAPRWSGHFSPAQNEYHSAPATAGNGLVHSHILNLNADRYSQNLSLSGVGALGLTQRGYLGFDWSYFNNRYQLGSNQRFNLGNLYARQDLGNAHYVQAGRMDRRDLSGSRGGNFDFLMLPLPQIDGLRAGTTQAYLNRQVAAQGSPVTLMLTQATRVDIYRGERLLGTQYLSAGVQQVDTSSFDAGSYALTLRMFENGVLTRTQSVPFSKSGMGIGGHPQWFVQAGRLSPRNGDSERYRQALSQGTAQLGGRMPLMRNLAGIAGMSSLGGKSFAETGLRWQDGALGGDLSVSTTYLRGARGAWGAAQNITYTNGASFSLYRYHMRGSSCQRGAGGFDNLGCYDSLNFSASTQLARWSLATAYSYSRTGGAWRAETPWNLNSTFEENGQKPEPTTAWRRSAATTRQTAQLTASRSFPLGGTHMNLNAGLFHSRGAARDTGAYVGLTFSFNTPPAAGSASSTTNASVSMRGSQEAPARMDYGIGSTWAWQEDGYREIGVVASGYHNETFNGSLRGRMQGRHGNIEGTVHDSFDRRTGQHRPGVSGSYSSSIAVAQGRVFLGDASNYGDPAGAVAVRVDSDNENAGPDMAAEISGGGSGAVGLAAGQSVLLSATGYDLTHIDIRDAGLKRGEAAGVAAVKGGGVSQPFLPPGKVLVKKVGVTVSYTYAGRLLHDNGAPLPNARPLNAAAPASSEEGGIVFDIDHRIPVLFVRHEDRVLQCPMTVKGGPNTVQLVGEVMCSPVELATLPADVRLASGLEQDTQAARHEAARPGMLRTTERVPPSPNSG
ncbi:fimbrial outer membrane usher protein TcfC [Achromobacter xylosoxidans]